MAIAATARTGWRARGIGALCLLLLSLTGLSAPAAPSFRLTDTDGKVQALAAYRGKWVVVNYWATWCPPCIEEIPELIALKEARKDVVVIGIAMQYDHADDVTKFADDNLINYPLVLGDDDVVAEVGPVSVLPTSYIYNPQGKLVKTWRGAMTRAALEKLFSGKK